MGNTHRHGKLPAVITKQAGVSWVFILLCLCLAAAAEASVGSDWLKGRLQGDGAYNTADGLATDYQATAETLHTLRLLDDLPADITPSLQRLADEAAPDTEYLSRRIIVEAEAGGALGALITQLAERRNEDGDFGDLPGYSRDTLNTAFALEALAAAERAAEAEPALNWLLQRQSSDGDWEGRVHVTALAMHALWLYRDARPDTIPPALNLARNWLLDQRSGELWAENFDTALALAALIPHADDISLVKSGVDALQALQSAAGDWDGDVYTTALALRALYLYEARRSGLGADSGAVKGRVLDGATGAGLAGISVSLHGVQGTRAVQAEMYGYNDEWQKAVTAYLALLLDKSADYNSLICTWHNSKPFYFLSKVQE
ncbi:MAG: hypothetical protein GY862_22180 [Gammaproteobacteria bacterium]|nr:hypothetical protein [Gammaproteobacteria bacterium]